MDQFKRLRKLAIVDSYREHPVYRNKQKSAMQLTSMCSELCTGWKPTNEICIDRIVPTQYKVL